MMSFVNFVNFFLLFLIIKEVIRHVLSEVQFNLPEMYLVCVCACVSAHVCVHACVCVHVCMYGCV